MRRKISKQPQGHLFKNDLLEQLTPDAPLLRLGRAIPCDSLEEHLAPLHAHSGRPAKPVRLMVGLLILKQLENLSDERVIEQWVQNFYFQAFCGERFFQWKFLCDPSGLTYFRKRIGEKGCEEIFKHSVQIHAEKTLEADVVVDTTVQGKKYYFSYRYEVTLQNHWENTFHCQARGHQAVSHIN